jgi:hypothetical protein
MMRKIACHYSKGRPGGRNFRDKIARVATEEEFLATVRDAFVVEPELSENDV